MFSVIDQGKKLNSYHTLYNAAEQLLNCFSSSLRGKLRYSCYVVIKMIVFC